MDSGGDIRDLLNGSHPPLHCATVWVRRVSPVPQRKGGENKIIFILELFSIFVRFLLQVELYMAELYNKIGIGLITWSPISLGLCSSKPEDQFALFTKLAVKVESLEHILFIFNHKNIYVCCHLEREIQQRRHWYAQSSWRPGSERGDSESETTGSGEKEIPFFSLVSVLCVYSLVLVVRCPLPGRRR